MLEKMKKDNKGFTLVELIVVIAILGILVAVLAPQYIKYVDKARWATDQNTANTLLKDVQVAVTDTDYNVSGCYTIALSKPSTTDNKPDPTVVVKSGTKASDITTPVSTATNSTDNLVKALNDLDPNWTTLSVKNKTDSTNTDKRGTYTIKVEETKVTGEWTA